MQTWLKWTMIGMGLMTICISLFFGIKIYQQLKSNPWVENSLDVNREQKPSSDPKSQPSEETSTIDIDFSDLDPNIIREKIEAYVSALTIEQKVGQMIIPAIRTWNGEQVTSIHAEITKYIQDYHLGGIILFRENIIDANQTKQLTTDLQAAADIPLFISIDQEGGLVNRIDYIPSLPGNMAISATADTDLAYNVGRALGQELRALGINMNMAPVLDVNNNPDNPIIGIRSFGDDPDRVATMGIAMFKGFNDAGIVPVGKHFPGHGDTNEDSHHVLPVVPYDRERLDQIELYPFKKSIVEGIPALMTTHITFPALDRTEVNSLMDGQKITLPATLSSKILTGLVREELGFEGLLITDGMEMNAITTHFGSAEAGIRAVQAGNDLLLIPANVDDVYKGLLEAVETGTITEERINQSVRRILLAKWESGILDQSSWGQLAEQNDERFNLIEVEKEVARAAITVVKDQGLIPLKLDVKQHVIVVAESNVLSRLTDQLKDKYGEVTGVVISREANSTGKLSATQKEKLSKGDLILVATRTAFGRSIENYQTKLVQDVLALEVPTIAVALGSPYDLELYPDVDGAIATYSSSSVSIEALVDVLTGNLNATGTLPVTIPDQLGKPLF